MRGKGWLYGYGLVAILHGFSLLANWELVRFVTKPLLMPILLVYFLYATGSRLAGSRHLITAALFFSWLGDIFLMNAGDTFFMAGLGSFLVAHIFYLLFFWGINRRDQQRSTWNFYVIGALIVYVAGFYLFLAPHLAAALKIPVFAYALMIAAMFAMAFHAFSDKSSKPAIWCITGAALFILSDSLLAINSFVQAFPGAGLAVMGTYILAQLAIVTGAIQILTVKLQTV